MPYQLIYTSAAQLLDSPLSGYGVVARSENMPAALVRTLIELSEYKEPADQGILGPQFSYRVEECHNTLYHIFTSVRPAGADYSKRSCHIAHHIALRAEEMHALCRGGSGAPTPAGILLSLELRRYWVHHWQKAPEYLGDHTLPPLTENPSVSHFPTWLVLTGSGDNARVFQTPPFHQGCLVIVPQKSQSRDLLRLLHESYTLSPTLGWGISFCTYSVEGDSLESTRRLFTIAGSALCARAQRVGFPMLELRPGFRLVPQSAPAPLPIPASGMAPRLQARPASAPYRQQPPAMPAPAAAAPAAAPAPQVEPLTLSKLPPRQYHYAEDRSNDTFETPWRAEKRRISTPALAYGAAALMLLCCGVMWLSSRSGSSPTTPAADTQPAKPALPPSKFPPLVHEPATPAEPTLPTAEQPLPIAPPQPPAEEPTPAVEPAEAPTDTPAVEPAVEPAVSSTDTPTDTPAEPPVDEPAEPPTPAEEPADTPAEPPAEEPPAEEPKEPEKQIKYAYGPTEACLVGERLPEALLDILPRSAGGIIRLEHGDYCVHIGEEEDEGVEYRKGDKLHRVKTMSPGKGHVLVECSTNNPNKCILTSSDGSVPKVTLHLAGDKLREITVDGSKNVAVQLPLWDAETQKVQRILLLPNIRVRLTPAEKQPATELPTDNLNKLQFSRSLLDKKDKTAWDEYARKEAEYAAKNKKISCLAEQKLRVKLSPQPTLHLPQLYKSDVDIKIDNSSTDSRFVCKMKSEKPELLRVFKPIEELRSRFSKEFHESVGWDSGTPLKSLEDAYREVYRLAQSSRTPDMDKLRPYINLYKQRELANLLRRVYREHPDLACHAPANASPIEWIDEAKNIKSRLKDESNRTQLLKDMEEYLGSRLDDLLYEIRKEFMETGLNAPVYYLQLKDVYAEKGKLIWKFELQQDKQ